MTRRQLLKLGLAISFILRGNKAFNVSSQELPQRIRIAEDGKVYATIRLDPQVSQQVRDAATLLGRYFLASTGVAINVSDTAVTEQAILIHVGASDYVTQHVKNLQGLDADGFVIDFPDPRNIIIVGPTDWGTEFGVYEFLERYLGVRWLLPGPDGDYVPQHRLLEIPTQPVRQEPVFFSRLLSGLRGPSRAWARRQRMHDRIEFHHNLSKLFPPKIYTKTHPGFFPIRDGQRYLPPDDMDRGWQPCFTAPGIVDEAIKNIREYFAQHPEATSYSLGVNDGRGFCECVECKAQRGNRKNFLGREDYSDQYFAWANAVVKGVLQKYPDKWFGCLAYGEVAQPPSRIPVHPRIMPYMTYDRMQWVESAREAEGKRITELWQKKATVLGWYDYLYGTPYCLPRVYFHKMMDYYQYGSTHGVRGMYAEAYPNWGEGPKLYVVLKLQWNPALDVDAVLKEWYEKAVGKEAAPDLAAYYQIWEKYWTRTIVRSPWFVRNGQWLPFKDPAYLDLITDEITQSRKLLEAVVSKAATTDQRARANILLRAFEYYEVSAISYFGIKKGSKNILKNNEAFLRGDQSSLKGKKSSLKGDSSEKNFFEHMNKRRFEIIEEFEKDPVLAHPLRFDKAETLKW